MTVRGAIVGIGEALLVSAGDRVYAGGLASDVALHAVRLGRPGIVVSRVGQDSNGESVRGALTGFGVETAYLQSDPDLPTGRLTVRAIAGSTTRTVDSWAAFDNLQWDFDLADLAQQTDVVFFGELVRRGGQSRTTIDRFLAECRHALKIYDLTNRGDKPLDRSLVTRTADECDGIVVDRDALGALAPGAGDQPVDTVASSLVKRYGLTFVVSIGTDEWRIVSQDQVAGVKAIDPDFKYPALVALLHGALSGWDWSRSLIAARRYVEFVMKQPDQPPPDDFFERDF